MAFPPARNPRSGKQYKHKTRKKEEKKNQNYFTDTLSIHSEKQSFPLLWKWLNKKADTPFWLYKVYICAKGKVKWNGSVILRHSRPHSFSFLICALSSSVKSSARLSSALICSELFPMIRLATTCTMSAITMQCWLKTQKNQGHFQCTKNYGEGQGSPFLKCVVSIYGHISKRGFP